RRPPCARLFPSPTRFRSRRARNLERAARKLAATAFGARPPQLVGFHELEAEAELQKPSPRCRAAFGGRLTHRRRRSGCPPAAARSEEHTSELQPRQKLVC